MKLDEAKQKYVNTWGTLATQWGINKTMAQVHALLLVSDEALSTEEVMEQLQISRGNANMNLRALMDWGIVDKVIKTGERKDFYEATKDIWEIFKQITKERKRREIEPVVKVLNELSQLEDDSKEAENFKQVMHDLASVTDKVNSLLEYAIKADEHWLLGLMTKKIKN